VVAAVVRSRGCTYGWEVPTSCASPNVQSVCRSGMMLYTDQPQLRVPAGLAAWHAMGGVVAPGALRTSACGARDTRQWLRLPSAPAEEVVCWHVTNTHKAAVVRVYTAVATQRQRVDTCCEAARLGSVCACTISWCSYLAAACADVKRGMCLPYACGAVVKPCRHMTRCLQHALLFGGVQKQMSRHSSNCKLQGLVPLSVGKRIQLPCSSSVESSAVLCRSGI
jgi:hypothetical protein